MKFVIVNHIHLESELSATTQLQVVRALNELGHPTALLVPTCTSAPTPGPGHVHRLQTWSRHPAVSLPVFNLRLVARLGRVIRRDRPDAVLVDHCSVGGALPFMMLSRFSRRFPLFVFDVRSQPVESTGLVGRLRVLQYLAALGLCARLLPGVTFLTEGMGKRELRRVGSRRGYGVWESGVDTRLFSRERHADEAEEVRRRLGLDHEFVVLYHGDVSVNRGLQTAIRAFALLRRADLRPTPVLAVLGDGAARAGLERLAEDLDAPVRFLGRVPYDAVPAYVAMADLALMALPDHRDWRYQFPLKFAECLASGTPTVVSKIPAFTEVAGDSPAVVYVPAVSPEAIADTLADCIRHRECLPARGLEGKRLAEEYSWERVAQRLVSYVAGL